MHCLVGTPTTTCFGPPANVIDTAEPGTTRAPPAGFVPATVIGWATPRKAGSAMYFGGADTHDAVQRAAKMIPTEGAAEAKQSMLDEMDRMSRHLWGVVERQQSGDGHGLRAIAQLLGSGA